MVNSTDRHELLRIGDEWSLQRLMHAAARIRRRTADTYVRELGEKGIELARIAQVAYREGEQGILELLDAQRVSLLSQLRVLDLSASAKQAEIELDRAAGEEVLP